MIEIRILLKRILLKLPIGKRFWQISKAILLLRQRAFRQLFFEVNKNDICIDMGANLCNISYV